MQIQENISLKPFNTFGIDVMARKFTVFNDAQELEELMLENVNSKKLILGGGSNILLTQHFDGLVLKNEIKGIQEVHEDHEYVYVKVGAGVNWHQFVLHCIERNWAGVENLSLIPGNVGASPMQNIGAYGVELNTSFFSLEGYNINDNKVLTFSRNDCEFGYRESVFKGKLKDQFVILNVTYQLRKHPKFNISYGAIEQELEKMARPPARSDHSGGDGSVGRGIQELSIKAISNAVINIRSSKLPDPKEIGNAGSFFKNPEVSNEMYLELKGQFADIVGYPLANGNVKLAAGWLIEQCGPENWTSWKGYRKGDAGCHAKQALVLVNYNNAKGNEIFELSEQILQSVSEKFDVTLEREVNII